MAADRLDEHVRKPQARQCVKSVALNLDSGKMDVIHPPLTHGRPLGIFCDREELAIAV